MRRAPYSSAKPSPPSPFPKGEGRRCACAGGEGSGASPLYGCLCRGEGAGGGEVRVIWQSPRLRTPSNGEASPRSFLSFSRSLKCIVCSERSIQKHEQSFSRSFKSIYCDYKCTYEGNKCIPKSFESMKNRCESLNLGLEWRVLGSNRRVWPKVNPFV